MAEFMNFPTQREQVLIHGKTRVGMIAPLCLVSHFQVGPWQVLYRPMETGNVKRWGMPLMIPNFSRLMDGIFKDKGTSLPIHGFGRLLPWTTTEQDSSSIHIQLISSDATRASYPYEFTWTARVAVDEGTLTYTLTMENRSDETVPIAPGFHPYFALAQQDKARLRVDGLPDFQASAIDWERHPPDNAYPFLHQARIQFPQRGTLTIAELPQDNKYSLANMQVWSEPMSGPDFALVCFEPTVSSEDALNRPADRLTIAPHSSQRIVLRLTAEPL